ncbi:TfoX/Sxy family protein [Litoribrevibacter albus]|uniref:Transcriptional regulator n=1 Tax=Litoribrevibacter albus TaxID=1473156 RepID=A0AA37SAZ3_9GAMM|nr:TfoX/Sxy family protein [Litoribrevibacter albus]GLQ32595.1 transcriptional regulator [Litoribrevibacter albus]
MSHSEFADYLCEQLMPIGPVRAKRMFGGYGLFLDDLMFGLIADDVLYLKTDELTRPNFESLGLEPFSYSKKDKVVSLSYSQAPEDAIEDPHLLCEWANAAFGAALRSANNKKKNK